MAMCVIKVGSTIGYSLCIVDLWDQASTIDFVVGGDGGGDGASLAFGGGDLALAFGGGDLAVAFGSGGDVLLTLIHSGSVSTPKLQALILERK